MTAYTVLAVSFLLVAGVAGAACALLARGHRPRPLVMVVAAVVMLTLTAVFDSVMIAAGLFDYTPELIHGARVWLAPVEDFAYPLAALALLPALWSLLRRRRDAHEQRRPPTEEPR